MTKPDIDIEAIEARLEARDTEVVGRGYAARDSEEDISATVRELVDADYTDEAAELLAHAPNDLRALLSLVRWQSERIAELEAGRRQWVPVENDDPPLRHAVLAWCPDYRNIYCANVREDGLWYYFAQCGNRVQDAITHWMPLPEPPEED